MWRVVLEGHSLTEVQSWDLEQLDAFLAVLEMQNTLKAAAHTMAAKPKPNKGD